MKKRATSLLLCFMMILSILPTLLFEVRAENSSEVNEDGFVRISKDGGWTIQDIDSWNRDSVPQNYPVAMDDSLYYESNGNYYPVKTYSGNYLKHVSSPGNPLEFKPENFPLEGNNATTDKLPTRADTTIIWEPNDGYPTPYYVKDYDNNLYPLYLWYDYHTSGVIGENYQEYLPVYKKNNEWQYLWAFRNNETFGNLYTAENGETSRFAKYDGWYHRDNNQWNAFKYDLFEKVVANVIYFETGSQYEELSQSSIGGYHGPIDENKMLAYNDTGATVLYNDNLYYRSVQELPEAELASGSKASASTTGIRLDKELYLNDDGTYSIKMETYATGGLVSKAVPSDIVLVLDQSGSMSNTFTPPQGHYLVNSVSYANITETSGWFNPTRTNQYYIKFDGDSDYYLIIIFWMQSGELMVY